MENRVIVIEHLEAHLSRWLRAEYEHSKKLVGSLAVTNAGDFCEEIAALIGEDSCYRESILSLEGLLYSSAPRVIILDPRAEKPLTPEEAANAEAIVIGGILGDHPPRGRTWKELTERALARGMQARNLGPHQLSIDGAVYVTSQILKGKRLEDIELVLSPVIEVDLGDGLVREIELPFAYPLVNGRPLISEKVLQLLRGGLGYEEYRLLRRLAEGKG